MKNSINNKIIIINITLLLIFSVSILILLYFNFQFTKENSLKEAQNKAESVANFINSDIDRIIFGVESVLVGINDVLDNQINRTPFNEKTKELLYSHQKNHILDLLVVNKEGKIINWSEESNNPPNILDRKYTSFHLNKKDKSSEIFIGNPLISKVHKDKWFFAISKAFYKGNDLDKILVAIIDIDFFSKRYLKNKLDPNSSIFVGSNSGFLYTRIPNHKKHLGKYVKSMHTFAKQDLDKESFFIKSPLDGKERFIVIVKSNNYPIVSGNTILKEEIFSKWERNKILSSIIVIVIVLGIVFLVIVLSKNQQALNKLSNTDYLTDVYNRRYFMSLAYEEYEKSQRLNTNLAFIMIDIDNFKQINDTYGHLEGDKVIKKLTRAIKKNIREIDAVGRYGGEEFIVMILGSTVEEANDVSNRIKNYIEKNNKRIVFTSSFGITNRKIEDKNLEDIIDRSDKALYKSKEAGKDRITIL